MSDKEALRIANFVDSSLGALERKGNLQHALSLYNPAMVAAKVVHFTSTPEDISYAEIFSAARTEIFPYFDGRGNNLAKILRSPMALLRVYRKMQKERISIVRGRLPYFGSLIGCLAAKLLGKPSVVSLGGDNRIPQEREGRYYFGSRSISYGMESFVLRLCDKIIAPNEFTKRYVASILGERRAAEKVVVIPWILPSSLPTAARGEVDRRLQIRSEKPVIAIVGHINQYKFSAEMFRLATRLSKEVQFVFCGDGPLRAEGERLLIDSDARFVGWQPNSVVRGLLERADIVLVPMSGFVLLEAASLGRPVVTSNLEWHSELVENEVSGLLVDPSDDEQWLYAARRLLNDEDARARLGQCLADRYWSDYNPEMLLARERYLYAGLLGSPLMFGND